MSKTEINIPESLQNYYGNQVHRSAVDQVLAQNGKPHTDFDWDTLDLFYQSWISAEITRYDHWWFHMEVNKRIWGEAIPLLHGMLKESAPSGYENENTLDYAWAGGLYRYLLPDEGYKGVTEAILGCWIDDSNLRLWMWVRADDDSYPSDQWVLGDLWEKNPYQSDRYTSRQLKGDELDLSKNTTIDLSRLKKAAEDAIKKFKANL